jgi:5-methylcytosine-specific restriction endonuclease McrA
MIKINPYLGNAFDFYCEIEKSVRNSKSRPYLKKELAQLNDNQKLCYSNYDENFDGNILQHLSPFAYSDLSKKDLKKLYSYRKKRIAELRFYLTKHPINDRKLNTCQNCTINEVDTMDHLVPQEEFAEFAVHPKNLFPCCTACNRKKSKFWRKQDGNRLFLNLYIDSLPQEQYLFVNTQKTFEPVFTLKNDNNINDDIFDLISSHYTSLNLLQRFSDNSYITISTLVSDVIANAKHSRLEDVRLAIFEKSEAQKKLLGHNHWQLILQESLAANDDFLAQCINNTI